jgi:hypothetical protein
VDTGMVKLDSRLYRPAGSAGHPLVFIRTEW